MNKTPKWWLAFALAMVLACLLCLIAFFLLVWPPGALLVLAVTFGAIAVLVDVPRKPRSPR